MRAIVSNAASIRPLCATGSKSRPGWRSNCAAAKPPRSSPPAPRPNGGGAMCCMPGALKASAGSPYRRRAAILERLGFAVEALPAGDLAVAPPSWRGDIAGEADLVEEVLRIEGYDKIPAVPLPREGALPRPALAPAWRRAERVRRTLAARGLVETVGFSFISAREAELFGGARPQLRLVNPISAELDQMRPSLLPGLIAAARRNADRGFADAALFELGPAYRDDTPEGQVTVAAGLRSGRTGPRQWRAPPRPVDLFDAKAD